MSEQQRKPVPPYLAVGLSTIAYGAAERKHIKRNLQIIEDAFHGAISMANVNMPVKIVALAEGALTGFTDEIFDVPHVTAAREMFIDVPGEETEFLGRLAKLYNTYVIVQCKARWPEIMDDRFFNTMFVIAPNGEVVHKSAKNHIWSRERSCLPHDVYDRWTEVFGDDIDAFYPVLKTDDIGNIGTICCSDGEYPEAVRALTFNGAEVVYRPSEALPMSSSGGGSWMVQNRGHAEFNNVYMLCPNIGSVYLHHNAEHPMNISGGNSHIVDYQGNVMAHSETADNTFISAIINIEALRQFRMMNLCSNWLKDMRMELFKKMYDRKVHPINLWMDQDPLNHAAVDEIYRENIQRLVDMGAWTPPADKFQGAHYQPASDEEMSWEDIKQMWND